MTQPNPPDYKPPIQCVLCGKEIKALHEDACPNEYAMVDSGIVGRLYAPYGSNRDGEIFQIGVCDDCLIQLEEEGRIKSIGDYLFGGSI